MGAGGSTGEPCRVLVTGATGLVGGRLLPALAAAGLRARALVRGAWAGAAGAEAWRGDLDQPASLAGCCRGVEVVVHAGARLAGDARAVERTNLRGTLALLAEARAAGVRRLIFLSSSSVYRDGPLARADERAPRGGGSPYARSKAAAEDALLAGDGPEALVLRPPTLFGPGDRHFLPALAHAARSLAVPTTAEGGALRDALHVDDLVRALMRALDAPLAGPTAWNVTGPAPERAQAYLRAAGRALGVEPCLFEVPRDLPLDAPGEAWAACTRGLPRPPLPWELVPALLTERTLDDRLARAGLSWEPRFAILPGVIEALLVR